MAFEPINTAENRSARGGAIVKSHAVAFGGAELGTPAGYYELGVVENTEFTDDTPTEDELDESGQQYNTTFGERLVSLTGTITTRSESFMKLPKETRGGYFIIMHDEGEVNSKEARVFIYGRFTPKTVLALNNSGNDSGKVEFEFKGIKTSSAITIALATLTATGTAGWATNATATVTIAQSNQSGTTGIYERIYTSN
jgi:hypothetical protein